MITLTKSGDTINFTFSNSDHYLYGNGTISVPSNSLSLTIDESDMVTFKKSGSNDIFISATLGEFDKTKAELIEFYKENMVNAGISSGDVESMISSATSGFADSVSYNSTTKYVEFYNGNTKVYEYDASAFVIDGMVDNVEIKTISSGGTNVDVLAITFNVESGKNEIDIPLSDIFDPDLYYTKTEVDSALSGKADTSAVTADIAAAVSGKVDTSAFTSYSGSIETKLSEKVDTSAFTSYSGSIESRLSEDEEVTSAALNVLNETVDGKQNTLTAGTNIDITNDTISCTLPLRVGTGYSSLKLNSDSNDADADYGIVGGILNSINSGASLSFTCGQYNVLKGSHSAAFGGWNTLNKVYNFAAGLQNVLNNTYETAFGYHHLSPSGSTTFGDSGNTLFSVGNGGDNSNDYHNAFEIRQNGDIYVPNTDDTSAVNYYTKPMVRLQDYIQHKIVQMTQSEYDALANKDANTIYLIIN